MKILLLSSFNINENGPSHSQTRGIISLLHNAGHEVHFPVRERIISRHSSMVRELSLRSPNFFDKIICKFLSLLKLEKNIVYDWLVWTTFMRRIDKFDIILTVVNPFTTAVVGLLLADGNTRLIVDSGDPYSTHRRHRMSRLNWLKSRLERIVSQNTDAFIVPVRASLKDYPYRNNRYVVNNHIFENHFEEFDVGFSSDHITLVYVGRFYEGFREPWELFKAIASINCTSNFSLELVIFGFELDSEWFTKGLKNLRQDGINIEFRDAVDRDKMLYALKVSDICVNIENTGLNQVPSKLVDYALSGSYTLNLGNSRPYFGRSVANDYKAIRKELLDILEMKSYLASPEIDYQTSYNSYLEIIENGKKSASAL